MFQAENDYILKLCPADYRPQNREISYLVCLSRLQGCSWLLGASKYPLIVYFFLLAIAGMLAKCVFKSGVKLSDDATSGIVRHPFSG